MSHLMILVSFKIVRKKERKFGTLASQQHGGVLCTSRQLRLKIEIKALKFNFLDVLEHWTFYKARGLKAYVTYVTMLLRQNVAVSIIYKFYRNDSREDGIRKPVCSRDSKYQ